MSRDDPANLEQFLIQSPPEFMVEARRFRSRRVKEIEDEGRKGIEIVEVQDILPRAFQGSEGVTLNCSAEPNDVELNLPPFKTVYLAGQSIGKCHLQ